jgi:O-antigen/teichoic acid export membrane protein
MKKQLLSSTIFKLLERFTFIIISLLLTPYLINNLGIDGYGFWLLVLSVLGWFSVVNLGFPSAVQRHIIFALESNDTKKVNTVFSTSMLLFTVLGIISSILLLIISRFSFTLFGSVNDSMTAILSFFAVKVFLDFIMNAFHGFFSAFMRYDIDSNITSLNVLIKSILIVIAIPIYGVWGAVISTLIADIITNALKIFYAKKLYPPLSFKVSYFSYKEIKSLFAYSKHVIAAGVARAINLRADPFIINKFLDITSVATYGVANRLAMHVRALVFTINDMLSPIFIKKAANNEDMEMVFHNAININCFTACLLFTPLIILGNFFITLWVGEEFKDAIYIIYFVVFTFICRIISSSINQILFAQAKHKLISVVNLAGAILNITLSIILSKTYGLIGIAMGTSIGFFISDIVLSLILLKRYNPYKLTPVIINLLKTASFIYIVGLGFRYYIEINYVITWFNFILIGILASTITLILSWLIILNKKIKKICISYALKTTIKIRKKLL